MAGAVVDVDLTDETLRMSEKFMKRGLRTKDSFHMACALYADADYFITVVRVK